MSYTKTPKPKIADYLEREEGSYLLLEHGGRIVLRRAYTEVEKPSGSYMQVAKPTGSWSKEVKPSIP